MMDSVETEAGAPPPDLKKARRQKTPDTNAAPVDRLPPHSIEAEQGVLGCVLLSPNECMGISIEKFKTGAEVFYDLRHRHIYELLAGMYDHKEAIDLLTVQQRLKDHNQLEAVRVLASTRSSLMRRTSRSTSSSSASTSPSCSYTRPTTLVQV